MNISDVVVVVYKIEDIESLLSQTNERYAKPNMTWDENC